jgi:apolipoprotein N-acyltransferase
VVIAKLLLAAAFFAGSFEPIGQWYLAPIAYALLLNLLRSQRHTYLISFFFAFLSHLWILNWSGAFVGLIPWLFLALLQGLYYLPLGFLSSRSRNIPALIFLILFIDEVKSRFPFGGFGWTKIAFTQIESPFVQSIALGGVAALSSITLLISWFIIQPRITLALSLCAILLISIFAVPGEHSKKKINVRAIQGGVSEPGLDFNARAFEVLKKHIRVSEETIADSDELIIWPENAIDIDPLNNLESSKMIADYLSKTQRPLIAGAVIQRDGLKNVAISFSASGQVESIYEKRYLTPFGEFIPMRSIAELFSPYTDYVTDFSAGSKEIVHNVDGARIASVICYEIINDGIVRDAAINSSALIVHTNSATFYGTSEGAQQLVITRLRAIEHRKSIVSVSTTGPSAIIDSRGVVLEDLREDQESSIAFPLTLNSKRTLADLLGGYAQLLILSIFLMISIATRRRSH